MDYNESEREAQTATMAKTRIDISSTFQLILNCLFVATIHVGIGLIFYSYREDISPFDALYLSIITLTSVGYGDIEIELHSSKIFSSLYFLFTTIVASFILYMFTQYLVDEREKRLTSRDYTCSAQIRSAMSGETNDNKSLLAGSVTATSRQDNGHFKSKASTNDETHRHDIVTSHIQKFDKVDKEALSHHGNSLVEVTISIVMASIEKELNDSIIAVWSGLIGE